MNKKRKIILSLGVATSIVAPVVFSVAFASNATTLTFASFVSQVNDKTTDAQNTNLWNTSTKSKFLSSRFYKEIVGKNNSSWNIEDGEDITSHLATLFKSTEFTDQEKVTIAKYIINNEAFADFFVNEGFDVTPGKEITLAQIQAASNSNTPLNDPSKLTATNLTYNDTFVPLKGMTGINKDWQHNDAHDAELNISNQTAIEYFVNVVSKSPQLKTLSNWLTSQISGILAKTTTLKDVLTNFSAEATSFLGNFATTKTPVTELIKLSTFSFLQPIDFTNVSTTGSSDDAVYERVLLSGLGSTLFGASNVKEMIAEYKATIDETLKGIKRVEIISLIMSHLTALQNAHSEVLDKAVYTGAQANKFDDSTFYGSVLKFAKFLLDYSNTFSNDVQIRAISKISESGYGLYIKSGHDVGVWYPFNSTDLDVPNWVAGDSILNPQIQYSNISSAIIGSNTGRLVVNTSNINIGLGDLTPEPKAVMSSGSARHFYMDFQVSKGNSSKSNAIQLWENDHDSDGAVKYSNWNAVLPSNSISWDVNDNSQITRAYINFYYDNPNITENSYTTFNAMVVALNSAKTNALNQAKALVQQYQNNAGLAPSWFNPTLPHEISISLKSVSFGKTYFNTYDDSGWDDTHADHFRFADINANFEYQIIEINQ